MNGNSILLDTNIILYLLSGDKVLSNLLFNRKLYVSFVTQLELLGYQGITMEDQNRIEEFLDKCIIIDINNQIKGEVIRLKRIEKIKLPDSIILGTSKYLGIPVITSDKGISKIETMDVIYYEKD
ncbi:MAG: PIN domain-containing protein [Cyclobacteriaceae bacterium]|nr:PIN domain-containing protein [Cyclobacteriaceae bacterium]